MQNYSPRADDWTDADAEGYRERLRQMSDERLRKQIEAGEHMVSPQARWSKEPRKCYVEQLRLAREEEKRRH